jgi:transposase
MQISLLQVIGQFGGILQNQLFPAMSEELGPLDKKQEQLIRTLALVGLDSFVVSSRGMVGRPPIDRSAIARAFVAKAVYNFPTTEALIDRLKKDLALRRLCGWETASQVPDKTVFSRAFARFAAEQFPQRVHEALIEKTQKERLIGHISRDATAIEAREKPKPKPKTEPEAVETKLPRRKRGEPKRPEQMKRIEKQQSMSVEEMLTDLPRACDVGTKTNSKGNKHVWIGYKLHLDVGDGQIPITGILTSASVHDSQAAIPLGTITAQRVTSLYDLEDAAYDCDALRKHSVSLGHVPIIERVKRGDTPVKMLPHEASRYRERTTVERVFSRLKEDFGGTYVRVRGHAKVMAHLMFGVLALTVDQILRLQT